MIGGVCMLIGEYQHTIDAKGRMIVPAKFREDLGFTFVVTRGLDGCLYGYPLEQWQLLRQKLSELPQSKKDARAFARFFNSAASEVEFDKQGRINIPNALIEHAFLDKDCVVNGLSNRIEIWDKNRWEDLLVESEASVEEIAEELEDFDF